jgi:hypothetical protein
MHRFEWPDTAELGFHLSHGDWLKLLRADDLEVTALIELYPHDDADSTHGFVDADWARRWPSEEVWRARKTSLEGDRVADE